MAKQKLGREFLPGEVCKACKESVRRHLAKGLCIRCYQRKVREWVPKPVISDGAQPFKKCWSCSKKAGKPVYKPYGENGPSPSEFNKDAKSPDGYDSACKLCRRERCKDHYNRNAVAKNNEARLAREEAKRQPVVKIESKGPG